MAKVFPVNSRHKSFNAVTSYFKCSKARWHQFQILGAKSCQK